MPPPAIVDLATLDYSHIVADRAAIARCNPQAYEFALLDAVIHLDREAQTFAGYHDVKPDAWWARGHIPGRPLFPGVLMIEVAAQLSSYVFRFYWPKVEFIGFGAVDGVKFRGTVSPPARLLVVGRVTELRSRRNVAYTQGFVDGVMVFEGTVTGMAV
jgi:3-hydroxyacyl-[acyl-carrier-protein] dehydratase